MLTLRLQRTGRKKLAQYRLVAQEHSRTPTSGKVAARLGSYDPHTKEINFDKEKIEKFLSNGAQPSNKVAKLLKANGYKLPSWVKIHQYQAKKVEEPAAEEAAAPAEKPAEEAEAVEPKAEKTEKAKDETKDETATDKSDADEK